MCEIKTDELLRRIWHKGFERKHPVSTVIIHGTGGGSTLSWMAKGGNDGGANYLKGVGLFHYLITQDGEITNVIDPDRWVYHSSSGAMDERTIGIECENLDYGNLGKYTNMQYESLFWLMFDYLCERYPDISIVSSHNAYGMKYSEKPKTCPGPKFSWVGLEDEFMNRGYFCVHAEPEYYCIRKK